MTTLAQSTLPPRATISVLRLNLLRIAYAVLTVGLALFMWPLVICHTPELAIAGGVRLSLLAGMGALAALGLRYPLQMLPLLLFELLWKAIYLVAFALPLWRANQITPEAAEDIKAVAMVVILVPLIPWRYVWTQYVRQRGEPWIRRS